MGKNWGENKIFLFQCFFNVTFSGLYTEDVLNYKVWSSNFESVIYLIFQ
jgi:hypothetical protein